MKDQPIKNKDLKRRIIELSYKYKLSHLGSCLTAVDIIDEIYQTKKLDEKFVLSSGHAGLALYCVIEKYLPLTDAEYLFNKHGVHPNRDMVDGIDCSTGSLGHGLPIAVGMALADRTKNVYCLISDGEAAEGSIWEAWRIIREYKIDNIKIYLNDNGYGAYKESYLGVIPDFVDWRFTNSDQLPFLNGLDAHYKVMNDEEYKTALEVLG
jgi:transketolase